MIDETLKSARILIVDDEPVNVKLLEKILASAGYTCVMSTNDPREVEQLYTDTSPDLILLDINMPYMDGFDVMTRLNEIEVDSYLPILVLTAQTDQKTRIRALESGAKDFATKPFDRAEILNRIRNMLEVRTLHNQVRNQNRILEQKVTDRTRELFETRMEIIRRLGRAAEYRDNETGLHIIRMSKYSQQLALAYGMDDKAAEMVLNASPMHDVGKIGIPDRILLKPGKLDADEWHTMQSHAAIGAELLAGHDSELMHMASMIAETHHEKFDGSGYPKGLAGEEIPLVGRIVVVCDVFDALTSARPYKKAWSVQEAFDEIERTKGKHFDPQLVDLFFSIQDVILEIKELYAEPELEQAVS
ncbi:two-component system response regulator [Solemya pervernicosa gill symbiont]|uniref:Two-component system response regulator n=2 Tax=Gammaproteobacteria incertae sedis TaxID=118884 RepID=A0A1T2L2X1_9GAMM|nr:HD domain-containing phosphohydrolase [Candidatus Reidiella endopervernicosa]OOZ39447.1 two-component system response regulator [Solemya pervernicosa gill symbiont]QKQ26702.1 response regulator [Candidatus Reidiella endopervernicosa]